MFTRKIANQFIFLSVSGTLLVAFLIGSISIFQFSRTLQKEAETRMLLQAGNTARQLNIENAEIETAVKQLSYLIVNKFDLEQYRRDASYLDRFNQQVSPILKMSGEHLVKPMDVFIAFDPEFVHEAYSIMLYNKNGTGIFVKDATDNISLQSYQLGGPTMQWFYQPKKEKKPLWTDPYYWSPFNTTMVSYVVPIYIKGEFIGVVGMDVNFEDYEQTIRKIRIYQSGFAALLSPQLTFQVHPHLKPADDLNMVYGGALSKLGARLNKSDQGVFYTLINGKDHIISFAHLTNGNIVLLFTPLEEALDSLTKLRWLLIPFIVILCFLATLGSIYTGRKIAIPIQLASSHATLISAGDFSRNIPDCILKRPDEIGQLGQALARMTGNLQNMLDSMTKTSQELALSEEKYSKAFHYAGDVIGIIRLSDQRYIEVSDAFYNIFGYSPEEVIGHNSCEFGLWHLDRERDYIYRELASYHRFHNYEVQWYTKSREIIIGLCSAEVVDISNEPCIIYVLHDITERKKVEEELRQAHDELEIRVAHRTQDLYAANQELQAINQELSNTIEQLKMAQQQLVQSEKMASLGSLVAGVAHEAATPIGVAVTTASHLKEISQSMMKRGYGQAINQQEWDEYTEDSIEASSIILKNLERAAELIRSFKQVSVDQSSEVRRTFKIKDYLDEILMSMHPRLKKTRLAVSVEGDPNLQINTFPGALAQIITNLLMNSELHAYDPNSDGRILIQFQQINKDLAIRYADDGKGIEPDVLLRIFDPFFTTKRASGGTGLGLYIVYNIVTMKLGGSITCSSDPGKGTCFDIRFPLQDEKEHSAACLNGLPNQ